MGRTTSLATALLLLAGAAFAALGVRAWRLEETEVRRRAEDRAGRAVRRAAARAMDLAREGHVPPEASWTLSVPLRLVELQPEDALLLSEAAWQERTADDGAAAVVTLRRLVNQSGEGTRVAELRLGILLARLGRLEEAGPWLSRAAAAPPDLADDQDVPVAQAARYHRARLDPSSGAALAEFLEAADYGRRLGGPEGRGPADLVLALEREAAAHGRVPESLAEAVGRVRRGRSYLGLLPAPGVAVAGSAVLRRTGDVLEARRADALLEEARVDDEVSLQVVPTDLEAAAPHLSRRLDPPLAALSVVARIHLPPSSSRIPWNLVAGLAVYVLGSLLAVVALRRAVRTARLQGDFVAAVSHELKTPIASVRAMAEMLSDGAAGDAEVTRRYAERIGWEMERLGASVANVLDAARIERTGETPLTPRPGDPAQVARDVLEAYRPGLERRGHRLAVDVRPSTGGVWLDAEAIRGVLANLLDNAAKYGGERKEIDVEGSPTPDGGYRIAVRDRGLGIPPGERERVFGRFFRGRAAQAGAIPGVGLGLHVARQVVEGHGGRIRAEDRDGGGTSFVVDLPGRTRA